MNVKNVGKLSRRMQFKGLIHKCIIFSARLEFLFLSFLFLFSFAREYIVSVFPLVSSLPTNGRCLGLFLCHFINRPFSGF